MLIDFEENEQNVFLFLFLSINGYFNLFLAKQFIKEIFVSFPTLSMTQIRTPPSYFPLDGLPVKVCSNKDASSSDDGEERLESNMMLQRLQGQPLHTTLAIVSLEYNRS